MSGTERITQGHLADLIAEALDETSHFGALVLAAPDSDDEQAVVVEVLYPDTPAVAEFTVRVTKKRVTR